MTKIGEKSSSHYLPVFAGLLCLAALAAACDAPPGIAATSDAIRHDIDMAWQACQEVSGSPTASHLSGQVFGVGNSYYDNSPNGYYVGTDTHVIGFCDISKGWSNRLTSDGQASTLAAAQAVVCSREVYTHVRT